MEVFDQEGIMTDQGRDVGCYLETKMLELLNQLLEKGIRGSDAELMLIQSASFAALITRVTKKL